MNLVECSILNAYVLDEFVRPGSHSSVGREKQDMLQFHEELADVLIGSFSSQQKPGRPLSIEEDRLNPSLSHYPDFVNKEMYCMLCQKHETRMLFHCKVYWCACRARNCFKDYHTRSYFSH